MDVLGARGALYSAIELLRFMAQIPLYIADLYVHGIVRGINLYKCYGPSGIAILLFGSRMIWQIAAQILGQVNDHTAVEFKEPMYVECTMISVALCPSHFSWVQCSTDAQQAAIVAQIAITGLSLSALSETR